MSHRALVALDIAAKVALIALLLHAGSTPTCRSTRTRPCSGE